VSEQRPLLLDLCRGRLLSSSKRLSKEGSVQERQGVVCKILSIDTESLQKKSIDCPKRKTFTVKIPILTKQIIVMDTTNYNNKKLQSKKSE
jgi:hypothetical protein